MADRPTPSSAAAGGTQVTIFVQTLWGSTHAVDVSLDDTVEDLKEKILEKNICFDTIDSLRLIFAGKQLENARKLRHYGVTNRSILHLIQRLRGGGDASSIPPQVSHLPAAPAESGEKAQPPHSSSPDRVDAEKQTRKARRAVAAHRLPALLKKKCARCVGETLPEVSPEIVPGQEQNKTIYRAHLPGAGSFYCSETGLGFEVSAAVTVEYEYGSWAENLSTSDRWDWTIAGPLFHIRAEPGAVRAVHLPHFVCLADGADESLCQIAHFEAGRMTLERPTRINASFVVLANPSFSQLGVLWRKIRSAIKFLPIHSLVLIYRALHAADITLHLYLIPNDHSLRKAIDEEEMKWKSKLVPKSPQTEPLYFGAWYQVCSPSDLEITPTKLFFRYWSPEEQQSYTEIYTGKMEKGIRLHVNGQDDGNLVWEALVRPGAADPLNSLCNLVKGTLTHFASSIRKLIRRAINSSAKEGVTYFSGDVSLSTLASQTPAGEAFVRRHQRQLRDRMGQIQPVLARLREKQLLTSEEEEEVRSERMSQMRNNALLRLVERKGTRAQEELYQTLRETDPYLVQDLEQSS